MKGIILAGGIGSRFGADKPKQYCTIFGKEMIWYTIDAFRKAEKIDDFIVVVDENEMKSGRLAETYNVKLVQGGSTRNKSFKNALEYIKKNYPDVEVNIEHAESLSECKKMLMLAKAGKKNGCLIEGMGCPGGCVAGAGTNIPIAKAQKALADFVKNSTKPLPPKELEEIELK